MTEGRRMTNSQGNISKVIARSDRRTIIFAILIPLMASGLLFLNDYRQRKKVAHYFTEILRYEIVRGSMRDAVFQSQRMIISDGPFYRMSYEDFEGRTVIDQSTNDALPFLHNSVEFLLSYNNSDDSKSVGTLKYYYSLEDFFGLSLLFFFVSLMASATYLIRQRRLIAIKIQEEVRLQKNEAIARTINNLAHDLRAPLNMLEIFLHQFVDRNAADYKSARQGLLRIQAMLDSLRYNEIDSLVRPSLNKLDVGYLVQMVKQLAQHESKVLAIDGDHDVLLNIDQPKMERVIQNLVVNAIEAAQKNVYIEFKNDITSFKIIVGDDGSGIPKEILPALFKRGTTFGKPGGTGLGLSYCKVVVEGHGGTISYQRSHNLTSFTVELPMPIEITQNERGRSMTKNAPAVIKIGLFLQNEFLLKTLKATISGELRDFRISEVDGDAADADIVFVDDLEFMATLQNKNLAIIFVRPGDQPAILIEKLRIAASRHLKT